MHIITHINDERPLAEVVDRFAAAGFRLVGRVINGEAVLVAQPRT